MWWLRSADGPVMMLPGPAYSSAAISCCKVVGAPVAAMYTPGSNPRHGAAQPDRARAVDDLSPLAGRSLRCAGRRRVSAVSRCRRSRWSRDVPCWSSPASPPACPTSAGKPGAGGTWCLPCDSPLGPFDVNRDVRMTDESLYSGRLVCDRTGRWTMLAFRNHGPDGRFIGELADPMPIGWATDGSALRLDVAEPMTDALPGRSSLPHRTGGLQMAQIALDQVEKAYPGGVKAVDDLSLDIADGEFMVLVGPSGCGKSTALRTIAGLEEITAGHDHDRGPGGQRPAAEGPGHRDGVPELRPVPAHDGRAEPGVRAAAAQDAQGRDQAAGRRGRQDARPGAVPQAQAGRAVRRAAAAGRDGPGHRPRAAGVPDGRAAVATWTPSCGCRCGPR